MTTQPPSQSSQSKEGKDKQARRIWTAKEEAALFNCMLDLATTTWKVDNGFKTGFYVLVEKALQMALPGTNLRAKPNITSKVKNWKEKYAAIKDAISMSGFNWDSTNHCIQVGDESVWNEYEKVHKEAQGLNGQPFPMFESWKILFGNDRATGEESFDPAEIHEDETPNLFLIPEDECYIPTFESGDPVFVNLSPHSDTDNISTPRNTTRRTTNPTTAHSETDNSSTPRSATRRTTNHTTSNDTSNAMPKPPPKKKSKLDAKEAALNEAFGSYMKESTSVLGRIADAVGYDMKLSNKRVGLFAELQKLDIALDDMFTVAAIISEGEERVDAFYGVPENL